MVIHQIIKNFFKLIYIVINFLIFKNLKESVLKKLYDTMFLQRYLI